MDQGMTENEHQAFMLLQDAIRKCQSVGLFIPTEETDIGHDASEARAAHICLDKMGIHRISRFGLTYSLWGRVVAYAASQDGGNAMDAARYRWWVENACLKPGEVASLLAKLTRPDEITAAIDARILCK